jgi:hypothetical protein
VELYLVQLLVNETHELWGEGVGLPIQQQEEKFLVLRMLHQDHVLLQLRLIEPQRIDELFTYHHKLNIKSQNSGSWVVICLESMRPISY